MRRIMMFLMVVLMVLTTVACGKKEEPEPFYPLDLDSTIVSIDDHAYPQRSSTKTSVAYIRETLEASTWTKAENLTASDGLLVYTIKDSKNDTYDFYDGSPDFVIVTREDKTKVAYTFESPLLTLIGDYLEELANYNPNEGFVPFRYDFVTFTDQERPGAILPLNVIQDLRDKMTFAYYVSSVSIDPSSGTLSYSITDVMGDRYDIYRAEKHFMIVTHADSSTRFYTINDNALDHIQRTLAPFFDNPVFTDHRSYQYYLGDLDGFSDEKLINTLAGQNEDIQLSLFTMSFYLIPDDDEIQDAKNSPVQLIMKDDLGNYVFVYTDPVTTLIDMSASLLVSMGKQIDGSDHRFFTTDFKNAYELITQVAYPALSGPSTLDLTKFTFTQVDILQNLNFFVYIIETVSRPYDAKFKTIIDRYASFNWTLVPEIDESIIFTVVRLKTTTKAMIYLAESSYPEPSHYYLVLDEDPSTPGALYYETSSDAMIWNWMKDFNYAAQIPLKETPNLGTIISVNDFDPDRGCSSDEPFIELTSAQSESIAELLKPETWTEVNFGEYEYYACNEVIRLKTSDGRTYAFDVFGSDYDQPYVRFFVYSPWETYFMPYDAYADLLEAVETIR